MHIDWQTVAAIVTIVVFVWGAVKGARRWNVFASFVRSQRGRRLSVMQEEIERAYEKRQGQLEGELARANSELDRAHARIGQLETALSVMRDEVKALPAIQALDAKVDRRCDEILEAVGRTG